MATVGTYEIGLDTPIHLLTPRQFFEMQTEWMSKVCPPQVPAQSKKDRWYVNKLSDLAEILGTSISTIYRMKNDGLLDTAISQYGRWVLIDVEKVIEIFKLSNRGKRRR